MTSTQGCNCCDGKNRGCADHGKETRLSTREVTLTLRQEGECSRCGDSTCKGPKVEEEPSWVWFACRGCVHAGQAACRIGA